MAARTLTCSSGTRNLAAVLSAVILGVHNLRARRFLSLDRRFTAAQKTFHPDRLVGDNNDSQRPSVAIPTHEFHPCLQYPKAP